MKIDLFSCLRASIFGSSLAFASWCFAGDDHGYGEVPVLKVAWKITGIDTPESVLELQRKQKHFFLVSAIEGDFFTKDGKGSIVLVDPKGTIVDAGWATGLNAPKGMAVHKDRLYVADIDEVVVIHLDTGAVLKKIPVPNAVFLNDVAADKQGNIFVSDTGTGQVFRVDRKGVEVYLEDLPGVNGLLMHKGQLMVGAGQQLVSFDKTRTPSGLVTGFPLGIDGIAGAGCGNYFVSAWDGQVYWVDVSGKITTLIDSVAEGVNTADITYSAKSKLLLVPNFFSNSVTAYKVRF